MKAMIKALKKFVGGGEKKQSFSGKKTSKINFRCLKVATTPCTICIHYFQLQILLSSTNNYST
jgi:hypothetical protein